MACKTKKMAKGGAVEDPRKALRQAKTEKRRQKKTADVKMPKDPKTPVSVTGQKVGGTAKRIKVGDDLGNTMLMMGGAKHYDAKLQRTRPPKDEPKKLKLPK